MDAVHEKFGFHGGISYNCIYFDSDTYIVILTNWVRSFMLIEVQYGVKVKLVALNKS